MLLSFPEYLGLDRSSDSHFFTVFGIPFTMGNILRICGKHQFHVKNTAVLEQFEKVDCIVFDKTGTITQNNQSEVLFVPYNPAPVPATSLKRLLTTKTAPTPI